MSRAVVGIDPSLTGTAICVLDSKTRDIGAVGTFSVPKGITGVRRLNWLNKELYRTLAPWKPFEAFIEGYSFMSKGRGVFGLAELGGVFRLMLAAKYGGYYEVPPTSLKKFVTGKGNSKKQVMLERTFRKFGIGSDTLSDDNQVDAFGLAMFGLCYLTWYHDANAQFDKYEKESFKGIADKCKL